MADALRGIGKRALALVVLLAALYLLLKVFVGFVSSIVWLLLVVVALVAVVWAVRTL